MLIKENDKCVFDFGFEPGNHDDPAPATVGGGVRVGSKLWNIIWKQFLPSSIILQSFFTHLIFTDFFFLFLFLHFLQFLSLHKCHKCWKLQWKPQQRKVLGKDGLHTVLTEYYLSTTQVIRQCTVAQALKEFGIKDFVPLLPFSWIWIVSDRKYLRTIFCQFHFLSNIWEQVDFLNREKI